MIYIYETLSIFLPATVSILILVQALTELWMFGFVDLRMRTWVVIHYILFLMITVFNSSVVRVIAVYKVPCLSSDSRSIYKSDKPVIVLPCRESAVIAKAGS